MARTNAYPKKLVNDLVKEIEDLMSAKTQAHGVYMNRCAKINEQISDVYDAGKEKGIPKKALRTVIKVRAAERKAESLREALQEDEQDSFDLLRLALGDLEDTELGKAALQRMEERKAGEQAALDEVGDTKD